MLRVFTWFSLVIIMVVMVVPDVSRATPLVGEPTADYSVIQRAFLREDFKLVATLAQTFITRNPNAPEVSRVWLWLALSLDRLERSDEALKEVDLLKSHLESGNALWPEVLFWEGEISRRAFQMTRASSAYQRLLQHYPDSTWTSQAQLGLGLIALHQQTFTSAIQYFHLVYLQHPGTTVALDARLFEGLCYLRLKQFREGVAVFELLLDQLTEPSVIAQTAFYLGEGLSGLGRYDQAATAYQRAIASSNGLKTLQWGQLAQFGLAWAYYQTGHCAESLDAFEQYLSQSVVIEHRTEALFAQGSCLMQLGKEDRALQLLEQIVSRDPGHPLAVESGLVIVDAYRRQERFALAKDLIHTLLRWSLSDDARAQVQLRLGAVALEQGNAAQANTVFELARHSSDLSIQQAALNGLGDVQMFLGNVEVAEQWYEKTIHLSGDTIAAAYASYEIGRIHLQSGAIDDALHRFQQLTTNMDPTLADDARFALVLAHINQHEGALARTILDAIRQDRPMSIAAGRAAYYIALLALDDGDEAAAQRFCEEAVSQAPRSTEAIDAQLLLTDLKANRTSVSEAEDWLRQMYQSAGLPLRPRARLAKRLGDFARAEQRYAEAIHWYEEAAALWPSLSGEATYRIASCYEEAGDLELAMHWYEQIEQATWRVRGQLALAKLLEREDRLTEAEAIYTSLAGKPIPEAKAVQERLAELHDAIAHEQRTP